MKCVKVSMGMCTHVPVGHYHLIEYQTADLFYRLFNTGYQFMHKHIHS